MPRTTVNIEAPILASLKKLQKREKRSLGQLISELVAEALARRETAEPGYEFRWLSKPMGPARVCLEDKDAVWAVLDQE
ncbi:MAG: antitoxin [Armatimonadetes bacterium]|nr:antitoxin [Armatimonadota bacterium]